MRSTTLIVLAFIPLTGCDWGFVSPFGSYDDNTDGWWDTGGGYSDYDAYLRDSDGMSQVSTTWMLSDGVAFDRGGNIGVGGASSSMACRFRTATGNIDVDVMPEGDSVTVEDGEDQNGDLLVITTSSYAISVLQFGDGRTIDTFQEPGVVGARFEDDGVVFGQQSGGCHVGWTGSGRDVQVGTLCGGFDASPTGTAVIVADGTVKIVSPSGTITDTDHAAQLVAWDYVHDQMYTALVGGDTVDAVATDGTVRWSVTLEGRITSLTDMGSRGAALVGLSVGDLGSLVVLDGADGSEVASGEGAESPNGLWASDDGSTIAVRGAYATPLIRMD